VTPTVGLSSGRTLSAALVLVVVMMAIFVGFSRTLRGRRVRPSGFRTPDAFTREAAGQDDRVVEVVLSDNASSDDVAVIRDALNASRHIRMYTFVAPASFLGLVQVAEQADALADRLARLPGVERSRPRPGPHA
jgi:hypothetical protein